MESVDYSGYRNILITREDRILTLTLNRPDRYNAVNHDLHEELSQIFADVARDDETSVVVLTGAGKAFCAGGDLVAMADHADAHGSPGYYMSMPSAKRIVFSLLELEKPIIAKINGPCMGLGATIALLCDITFMADHAKIGDPHVKAGVVAGDGGAVIWPQLIGYARAKELLMTGDPIDARRAESLGLVNYAVPSQDLDTAVNTMANKLAAGAQDAIRWSKTVANIGLRQLAHSMMDASIGYEWLTMRSATHREAIEAFRAGRQPDFRGL
ncbi:enoyl-CoA hydratase/isomerase family protein [Rhodococcus olei]|uniref:Enoyl-CoA hydratase/isomerase family protein n=1 Tax=Rhodococcus olei TaxID=2161675 RepID=A0ABP8NYN1_9NOCA